MRTLAVAVLLLSTLAASPFTPQLKLGWHSEAGVESKLVCTGFLRSNLRGVMFVNVGVAACLFQNAGLSTYGLNVSVPLLRKPGLVVKAAVEHEQWNDWRAGENRAWGMVRVKPIPQLLLGLGLAYRAPVSERARYASPFFWNGAVPEWNVVYGLNVTVLNRPPWVVSAYFANDWELHLRNPQQFPLGIYGTWRAGRHLFVDGRVGTAINGLSALLLSFSEVTAELGVTYAP